VLLRYCGIFVTKFYDAYKAVFDRVKADVEAKSNIRQVVLGEQFKLANLPLAIINPTTTTIRSVILGSTLENVIGFDVLVVIRETEPEDWFEDIVSVMADVVDALLVDRTLNGTVKDVAPTRFEPGEIKMMQKLYYGGVVRFEALLHYKP
jgi:hypothetical protein